ncbi:MAG: hypothetical protein ACRD3M_06255, partial [Thermoanaerobaculia bacterium]
MRQAIQTIKLSVGGPVAAPAPKPAPDKPTMVNGVIDWGESPMLRPRGAQLDSILDALPLDDRGKKFSPDLALANRAGYARRHKASWDSYLHAVESEKLRLTEELEAEQRRQDMLAHVARREAQAAEKRQQDVAADAAAA